MASLLIFLITIGVLVVIHEYGHFLLARKCGVKVTRFSIGFGTRLFSWYDKHGTEFTVSLIPLGGYVKMLDERVEAVAEEQKNQTFNRKTIAQRAMIIFAGPLANFLLAIVIFWVLAMVGTETRKSVITSVVPESIAANAGIMAGSSIVSINGQEARSVIQVAQILTELQAKKVNEATIILADRFNEEMTIEKRLNLHNWQYDSQRELPWTTLGIIFPEYPAKIEQVLPGLPADKAGLKAGDVVVKVNGDALESREKLIQFVHYHAGEILSFTIMRGENEQTLKITPDIISEKTNNGIVTRGQIGVQFANDALNDEYIINYRYNPFTSVWIALKTFAFKVSLIGSFLFEALTGNASMSDLAGPVGIAQAAGSQWSFGITAYLGFLAFLSINLGVMNLLPIPVLDGGHLLFLLIEKIKGSPVSAKIQQNFYLVGAALLISLMVITFISDFMRF